jgi:low-affinity inorganic phosphate transporter
VRKRHARSGNNQRNTRPEWRFTFAFFLFAMEPPLPAASTDGTQVTEFHCHPANTFDAIARVKTMLPGNMESYEPLSVSQRSQLRRIMLCISDTSAKLAKLPGVSKEDQNLLKKLRSDMLSTIEYARGVDRRQAAHFAGVWR